MAEVTYAPTFPNFNITNKSLAGTAGLVLAARLSEVPTVEVAVIEAGGDHSHDVNVLAPGLLTSLYGDPKYDWIYSSVPQEYMNGTVIEYPRGKGLGGSSAINYMVSEPGTLSHQRRRVLHRDPQQRLM